MNYSKWFFMSSFVVLIFYFTMVDSNIVFADGYVEHHREGHEEGEVFEDFGKMIGWGTVIVMVTAGLLYPIRKLAKTVITNFPSIKKTYISISKFFGKYHMYIGITAIGLSIVHGIIMFLAEGKLEGEGVIGLIAMGLLVIAGIIGTLFKNNKAKNYRSAHITMILFTLFVAFIHIVVS